MGVTNLPAKRKKRTSKNATVSDAKKDAIQEALRQETERQSESSKSKTDKRRKMKPAPSPTLWQRLNSPLGLSVLSGLLLFASFPPVGAWWLAWIAPIGWLILIGREELIPKEQAGSQATESEKKQRPYLHIWLGGFLYCMLLFHFIRLPHWAGYFGWVVLAGYLSVYPLTFVAGSRIAVHQFRMPIWVAAPVVWVGAELFKCYFFTGLAVDRLAQSQYLIPNVIQVSDLFGGYTLSFLMVLFASVGYSALVAKTKTGRIGAAFCGVLIPIFVLAYGHFRLNEVDFEKRDGELNIALIQGSIDTIFPKTEQERDDRIDRMIENYKSESIRARSLAESKEAKIDLMIWPESMFPFYNLISEPDAELSKDDQTFESNMGQLFRTRVLEGVGTIVFDEKDQEYVQVRVPVPVILGCSTESLGTDKRFNSAQFVNGQGDRLGRYDKIHRVVMGEYVPIFGDWFPVIYKLTPFSNPLTQGEKFVAFEVGEMKLAPNVCFESTVPHLIRDQVNQLSREDNEPDVLVNISNDGWFWGSSCLDLHLACNVFRAVEMRKPCLVSANTGISGSIDSNGQVLSRGPKQKSAVLFAQPKLDGRYSLYRTVGDWPAIGCCGLTWMLLLGGWVKKRQKNGIEKESAS